MANWPSIAAPVYPLGETCIQPQVRTEFEAGYVQSRCRTTRSRTRWTLRWTAMTDADYATLLAFFKANQGGSITWTHPITSASHTVRFAGDELPGEAIVNGRRQVTVELEEV